MLSTEHSLRADLILLGVTLAAAAGWIFSKEALAGMPPLLFIGVRFFLAGLILAAIGWRSLRVMSATALKQVLGIGALFAISMAFWILGLHHGSHLGEGAFITSLGVVMVPLIAKLFFKDQPPPTTWIALPIAVVGFGCLSLQHGFRAEAGQLFFLTSAFFFAIMFNINSRVASRIPTITLSSIQLMVVGALLLPVSALVEPWPQSISLPILGWLAASILIATCLRFFLQIYGQSLTSPSHAAVIMMLEPVWTALLAAYWFRETMSGIQFLGCSLIFLALIINRWNWISRLLRSLLARP